MITLTSNLQTVLSADHVDYFYLIKIFDDSTVHNTLTTFHRDITMGDGLTYLADGTLAAIDPPKSTTSVDRDQFMFALADPDFLQGSFASAGYIGKEVDARLGFMSNEVPLTAMADTLFFYNGYVDGTGYRVDTKSEGEALLQITCSSPMADLDQKKGLYLSRDFVRNRNPTDSCCDQIYSGSGKLQLKWGRF